MIFERYRYGTRDRGRRHEEPAIATQKHRRIHRLFLAGGSSHPREDQIDNPRSRAQAEEKISYQIPTFALLGNLIHFAAFKKHIGLYPPVNGDEKLQAEISRYKGEKGNLKFPLDEPIPYALIRRIVKFRVQEQLAKANSKLSKS